MPERASMIMLMNRPSTVVTVPFITMPAIPPKGTNAKRMESTSIIGGLLLMNGEPPTAGDVISGAAA